MKKMMAFFYGILFCLLTACSSPSLKFHQTAVNYHFKKETRQTALFKQVIYYNSAKIRKQLNIYLDGDGSPWINHRWIAKDPTARHALILDLMALDNTASILIGRPCYYGLAAEKNCHFIYWTSHRYGQKIITSMAAVIHQILADNPTVKTLRLIGYSGGGTIACLLAALIKQTTHIITVAANLNIDAWSQYHHYTPLYGSLNPIQQAPLAATIKQLHIAGNNDRNIPVEIIQQYVHQQTHASLLTIKNQGHYRHWQTHWPSILAIIKKNHF